MQSKLIFIILHSLQLKLISCFRHVGGPLAIDSEFSRVRENNLLNALFILNKHLFTHARRRRENV